MTHSADHDDYIAKGFCPERYEDDEGDHWCRMPTVHDAPHVAPYFYDPPKQEVMVRWEDGPINVKFVRWEPD